ncbi:hypothetical protein ACVV5U_13795 [Enterococcus faecalis]
MENEKKAKAGFNKNKRPSNEYKEVPKPKNTFSATNTDLLNNIAVEEDILKTNNKSLGIPASVWCEYMALLDTTDNDYTYELLEELIHERKQRFSYEEKSEFERILKRKQEQERDRITKKLSKKK